MLRDSAAAKSLVEAAHLAEVAYAYSQHRGVVDGGYHGDQQVSRRMRDWMPLHSMPP
jgi:hypothetical protein